MICHSPFALFSLPLYIPGRDKVYGHDRHTGDGTMTIKLRQVRWICPAGCVWFPDVEMDAPCVRCVALALAFGNFWREKSNFFFSVACKLLVKLFGFFCILKMDQKLKIYETETLRDRNCEDPSSDHLLLFWSGDLGEKKDSNFLSLSQSCKKKTH